MEKIIVIVANRTSARLFQYKGQNLPFQLLEEIDHPEGRLKNQDFDSSAPGESFDSHGHGRHDTAREVAPKDQEAKRFAGQIAEFLDRKRQEDKIKKIIISAEGGFQGMIKDCLGKETAKLVSDYVSKDLAKISERDIHKHFSDVLLV